jgi:NAD(P)-dependent dehydrogenase (short-subunit alcohol dehydrogenase family)
MKRAVGVAVVLVLAAAGAVVLLLAVDVARTRSHVAADDVAYRTAPTRTDLWQAHDVLPASWSRTLLGLDDDLRARRALHVFKLGRPRLLYFIAGPDLTAFRSSAQALLARSIDEEHDAGRRSQELNLLGVLQLIGAGTGDPQERQTFLPRAADTFRASLASNPANDDAKFNLELVLAMLHQQKQSGESQTGKGGTVAKGNTTGNGY